MNFNATSLKSCIVGMVIANRVAWSDVCGVSVNVNTTTIPSTPYLNITSRVRTLSIPVEGVIIYNIWSRRIVLIWWLVGRYAVYGIRYVYSIPYMPRSSARRAMPTPGVRCNKISNTILEPPNRIYVYYLITTFIFLLRSGANTHTQGTRPDEILGYNHLDDVERDKDSFRESIAPTVSGVMIMHYC